MMNHAPVLPAWHHCKPVLGWVCCLLLIFLLRAKIGPETEHSLRPAHPAATMAAPAPTGLPVFHLVDPASAPRDGITAAVDN